MEAASPPPPSPREGVQFTLARGGGVRIMHLNDAGKSFGVRGMSAGAHLANARQLLLEASLDPARWAAALGACAETCGARAGQLTAMDGERQFVGHWLVNAPDAFMRESEAFGFTDPSRNPRLQLGLTAALGAPVADQDYLDADARRRFPIYAGLYERLDLPFNCQVVLLRDGEDFVRASITRTAAQGPLDAASFRAFRALIPHLEAAVRMQANFHAITQAAALTTLDAVGASAFLLDQAGRVVGCSAPAEQLVSAGAVLQLSGGRLRLRVAADQAKLDAALACLRESARDGETAAIAPLGLSDAPFVIDMQLLPRHAMPFAGAAAMLAVLRPVRAAERVHALRSAYGLTDAEAAIALAVADGDELKDIAARRAVAVSTVRSQVQAIYTKLDVHRQVELAALVRRFSGL